MTFTVTPRALLGLLNHVSEGIPKRQRAGLQVTLSAGRGHVSMIGNGMDASLSVSVRGQGQCQLGWQEITDVLTTFSARQPVRFECNRDRLRIGSFSMAVEDYKPEAVSQDQELPEGPLPEPSLPKQTTPIPPPSAPDGYSLPPQASDDDDCTGNPGTVSPEDFKGSKNPIVCPVCQSVGYFKKYQYRGNIGYSSYRSWVSAQAAPAVVILRGDEKPRICPHCLKERLKGSPHVERVADKQSDIFERPESQ